MPFPRPRDTSVVFIARRMLDGSGSDGYHDGAREGLSRPASPLSRLPFAADVFWIYVNASRREFRSWRGIALRAERRLNLFLSSTISSIRFNIGFVVPRRVGIVRRKWKAYRNPIRVCFVCSTLILLLLLLLLLLSLLLSLLSLLMRMQKYNGGAICKW